MVTVNVGIREGNFSFELYEGVCSVFKRGGATMDQYIFPRTPTAKNRSPLCLYCSEDTFDNMLFKMEGD